MQSNQPSPPVNIVPTPPATPTKKIATALEKGEHLLQSHKRDTGPAGERVLDDVTQALRDTKIFVAEKDLGTRVGSILEHAEKAKEQVEPHLAGAAADLPTPKEITHDLADIAIQIQRLAKLIVTSAAFRQFVWEAYLLIRDTFGPEIEHAIGKTLTKSDSGFNLQKQEELLHPSVSAIVPIKGKERPEALPAERRKELVRRWEALIQEVKDDANLQTALKDAKETLGRLEHRYRSLYWHERYLFDREKPAIEEKAKSDLDALAKESRALIEGFAGGKSMQPLMDVTKECMQAFRLSEDLQKWVSGMNKYMVTSMRPGSDLKSEESLERLEDLVRRGQTLFRNDVYQKLTDRFLSETRDFLVALRDDKTTHRVRESLRNVLEDLFVDSKGRLVIKPEVYTDLRVALQPVINELLKQVPVHRIEIHENDVDMTLDNLVLDASELVPDQFDATNVNDVSIGTERTGLHYDFKVVSKGTTTEIKNVRFNYVRHAFPKLQDSGVLDVKIGGEGLCFDAKLEYVADATPSFSSAVHPEEHAEPKIRSGFHAKKVNVRLHGLSLKFRSTNHELLYAIFKPVINRIASKQIERAVEEKILHLVGEMNDILQAASHRIKEEIKKTAAERTVHGCDDNANIGHSTAGGGRISGVGAAAQ